MATITLTRPVQIVQTPPPPDVPRSIREMSEALMKEMGESALFKADDLQTWQQAFFALDLKTEQGLKEATNQLCYLLVYILPPALQAALTFTDKENRILKQDKAIRDILALTIPKGTTVDETVAECRRLFCDADDCYAEVGAAKKTYSELGTELDEGDHFAEELFDATKAALAKHNEERKEAAGAVRARLEALDSRVNQVRDRLASRLEAVSASIKDETAHRARILTRVGEVVKI